MNKFQLITMPKWASLKLTVACMYQKMFAKSCMTIGIHQMLLTKATSKEKADKATCLMIGAFTLYIKWVISSYNQEYIYYRQICPM